MKKRSSTALLLTLAGTTTLVAAEPKTNVLFIIADDFGWADVGYNGSTFYETPNLDRLAAQGVQFTNGYAAAPVSSPTRCSVLTGKHPARLGITDWIPGYQHNLSEKQLNEYKLISPQMPLNLPLEEVTIAEAMKQHGYQTALVGKWHCGEDSTHYPQYQGFDTNIGGWLKGGPNGDRKNGRAYFSPYNNPYLTDGPEGEYLTDRLATEAIQWMEKQQQNPFFLYLSFYAVHTPIQAKPEKVAYFKEKARKLGLDTLNTFSTNYLWYQNHPAPAWHWKERLVQNDPEYAALIASMDENIGRVLDYLTASGLDKNTMICFVSDNGGLSTAEGSPTTNAPLRAGKGWPYEGGIREPYIIKLPNVTQAGTVCDVPVTTTDFYPTILDACNLPALPKQHKDGVSLLPLLKGDKIKRKALYWHYPHYGGKGDAPFAAIRKGNWKLIEQYETNTIELYNLKKDLSETNNLAQKEKKRAQQMLKELHQWQKSVGAKMPQQNTNYYYKPQHVTIQPEIKQPPFQGWGISLSWWAHQFGAELSDSLLHLVCNYLTSPEELNMNIYRYNISGGDNPTHNHMRKDGQVPGYKPAENAPYDWTRDSAQRRVLLTIDTMRTDLIYEAANYSPPYWMTKSNCSAGDSLGLDNLKDDYYDDFAQYLATCVKHYKDTYNITFSTISPINEPYSDWWKAMGSQEGCYFSQKNQERIIKELHKVLKQEKMLDYTGIAAMDANSVDECLEGVKKYKRAGILSKIKQINTHTYAGNRKEELHAFAKKNNLPLWQSESGPLWVEEKGWENFLLMAKRIADDINRLQPQAWCDWQYLAEGKEAGVWAMLAYDKETNRIIPNKGFYSRKQFTHFISPGYQFLQTNTPSVVAALSPDKKRLVIVAVNDAKGTTNNTIYIGDLIPTKVRQVRTSEHESFKKVSSTAKVVNGAFSVDLAGKSVTTIIAELKVGPNTNPGKR